MQQHNDTVVRATQEPRPANGHSSEECAASQLSALSQVGRCAGGGGTSPPSPGGSRARRTLLGGLLPEERGGEGTTLERRCQSPSRHFSARRNALASSRSAERLLSSLRLIMHSRACESATQTLASHTQSRQQTSFTPAPAAPDPPQFDVVRAALHDERHKDALKKRRS